MKTVKKLAEAVYRHVGEANGELFVALVNGYLKTEKTFKTVEKRIKQLDEIRDWAAETFDQNHEYQQEIIKWKTDLHETLKERLKTHETLESLKPTLAGNYRWEAVEKIKSEMFRLGYSAAYSDLLTTRIKETEKLLLSPAASKALSETFDYVRQELRKIGVEIRKHCKKRRKG